MVTQTGLAALTQAQLNAWVSQAKAHLEGGPLLDYIPLLAQANPFWLAVQVQDIAGQFCSAGDVTQIFPLMSVIKPFVLLFLLEQFGADTVFNQVGMEPSEHAFNSVHQLEQDYGWPRNPLINSGAITLAALLKGPSSLSRCETLCQWLNQSANSQLFLDEQVLASVRAGGGQQNRTIAHLLARSSTLIEAEQALDTYNHICCLSGTVTDLAQLGMLLAQRQTTISSHHRRMVNALMTTCGLYQASGRFAVKVGLPTKSGVSGALLSVVPGQGAIACYGPALDPMGNSIAGLFVLEHLATTLDISVFN